LEEHSAASNSAFSLLNPLRHLLGTLEIIGFKVAAEFAGDEGGPWGARVP
jgi:hypothetical protein